MGFNHFLKENRLWHFMQIVSHGDNLHKMPKPIFSKKKKPKTKNNKINISKCRLLKLLPSMIDGLCWGLTTLQSLWVILCHLPEKGRKEIEEIVEEMKERDREERGTGMKVKKQKK